MNVRAFIGLGANLDDPARHVSGALLALAELPSTRVTAHSGLYSTPPMGPPGQPDYINAVAAIDTRLAALDLLDCLQELERMHGRQRGGERWGPRPLDLDILLYGDLRIEHPRLRVPHPGLHERAFVLYPLAEIAPDLDVPGRGALHGLLALCPADDIVRLPGEER